jgi:hypothetical protein
MSGGIAAAADKNLPTSKEMACRRLDHSLPQQRMQPAGSTLNDWWP